MATTTLATILSIGIGPGHHEPPAKLTRTLAARATAETTYRGLTAIEWAGRFKHRTWQLQHVRAHLRQAVMYRPTVGEAINLACATYGFCATLWRKARCETGGTLSPYAKNRSSDASGLFQFMPSTFRSTPYGGLSIWSPYANAMAAGWMHAHGRGGEWVCS